MYKNVSGSQKHWVGQELKLDRRIISVEALGSKVQKQRKSIVVGAKAVATTCRAGLGVTGDTGKGSSLLFGVAV